MNCDPLKMARWYVAGGVATRALTAWPDEEGDGRDFEGFGSVPYLFQRYRGKAFPNFGSRQKRTWSETCVAPHSSRNSGGGQGTKLVRVKRNAVLPYEICVDGCVVADAYRKFVILFFSTSNAIPQTFSTKPT